MLFGGLVCFFARKVLCMQVGTLTWIVDRVSVIAACHFNMVAVALQSLCSVCWTWSRQRRRRGRRPHDVHVRCFAVHGTIHMMVAESVAWSHLKHSWGNDLTFQRASRFLAKTGFFVRTGDNKL